MKQAHQQQRWRWWLELQCSWQWSQFDWSLMQTLYELVDPNNARSREMLKNTVAIIDPCMNPDGRDRYANFTIMAETFHRTPTAMQKNTANHGRENYPLIDHLFDLNRDWAWMVRTESRLTHTGFNQWAPHACGFSWAGANNPYYFARLLSPITKWFHRVTRVSGNDRKESRNILMHKAGCILPRKCLICITQAMAIPIPLTAVRSAWHTNRAEAAARDCRLSRRKMIRWRWKTAGCITTLRVYVNGGGHIAKFNTRYWRVWKILKDNVNNPASAYKTYVIKGDNNRIRSGARLMDG